MQKEPRSLSVEETVSSAQSESVLPVQVRQPFSAEASGNMSIILTTLRLILSAEYVSIARRSPVSGSMKPWHSSQAS